MSCYCDNCLLGKIKVGECENPKSLEDLRNQVAEEFGENDDWDDTPRCPGFKTQITTNECDKPLVDWEESICDECHTNRDRQLDLEDEAVEAVERRQIEMEEFQGMEYHGDFEDEDGDEEVALEDGNKSS